MAIFLRERKIRAWRWGSRRSTRKKGGYQLLFSCVRHQVKVYLKKFFGVECLSTSFWYERSWLQINEPWVLPKGVCPPGILNSRFCPMVHFPSSPTFRRWSWESVWTWRPVGRVFVEFGRSGRLSVKWIFYKHSFYEILRLWHVVCSSSLLQDKRTVSSYRPSPRTPSLSDPLLVLLRSCRKDPKSREFQV